MSRLTSLLPTLLILLPTLLPTLLILLPSLLILLPTLLPSLLILLPTLLPCSRVVVAAIGVDVLVVVHVVPAAVSLPIAIPVVVAFVDQCHHPHSKTERQKAGCQHLGSRVPGRRRGIGRRRRGIAGRSRYGRPVCRG